MAEAASEDLESLARELDLNAQMFGGAGGETARLARELRESTRRARGIDRAIADATPTGAGLMQEGERAQLRGDAPPQRRTREAADGLARRFAEGPDGTPLSPETEGLLREAAEHMERATAALESGDARGSATAQAEAVERLSRAEEQLAEGSSAGGSGGQGGGQGERFEPDERVYIPGANEFVGPRERRRRVLDAMGETAPRGYERAVQRYYEELLR